MCNPATIYLNSTNNTNSTERYYIKNGIERNYVFSLIKSENSTSLSLSHTHTHTCAIIMQQYLL